MKEFFDRYKIVIFLILALAAGLAFAVVPFVLWKFVAFIPVGVLGGYLLFKLFPRSSDEHLTVVRVNGDGSVLITKSAVQRSAADAVKVIQEVKYLGCEVENSRTGINILINVKILGARVVETSEVVKEFVKNLLEEELNVKVNKIDIVVKKVEYALKVKKIDPNNPDNTTHEEEEERPKKSKTNKAIEKANKAVIVSVSEFNSEYDFAVGNEKKRVVVKGGDDARAADDAHATEASAPKPAPKPTPKPVVTPAASTKPAPKPLDSGQVAATHPSLIKTAKTETPTPQYSVQPPHAAAKTSYPVAPKTASIPTTPAKDEHHPPIDLKAELAKRKAEREALLNKISADGNKLN